MTAHRWQCTVRVSRVRCERLADVWLVGPDGKRNPGGYVCRPHGEEIVAEYGEKLGEKWSLGPLDLEDVAR